MKLGSGYYSLAALGRRRRALMARLRRIDNWLKAARALPPKPKRMTLLERERRYARTLCLRESHGESYRSLAAKLKVSAARAERIYLDAVNWRKTRARRNGE